MVPPPIMRIRKVYLLIALSIWIHFDDVVFLIAFPRLQCAPLDADDDQYLSVERGKDMKWPCSRQKPALVSLKPRISDFFPFDTGKDAPLGSNFTPFNGFFPLYVLMSLQL